MLATPSPPPPPNPLSLTTKDIMPGKKQTVGLGKWLTYEPLESGECSQAFIRIITASEQAQHDADHGCSSDQGGSLGP